MNWPWKRPTASNSNECHATGGADAHREATKHLARAIAQGPEVKGIAGVLRELREKNGFLELIENAVQGGRQ